MPVIPVLGRRRQEHLWSFWAWQSKSTHDLHVQWETLPQRIRWWSIEEEDLWWHLVYNIAHTPPQHILQQWHVLYTVQECGNTAQQILISYTSTSSRPQDQKTRQFLCSWSFPRDFFFYANNLYFFPATINLELHAGKSGHKCNTLRISSLRCKWDF